MKYTQEQAAIIIQRAVRNRRSRKTPQTLDEMRRQELEILKQKHREKLEAKEREYLFLSKLPAEAVMKLYLRKQHQAATLIQAFWRGRRVRRRFQTREPLQKSIKRPPIRTYRGPPDTFYKSITSERHEYLIKQIRLKGSGDLEEYKDKYSNFLERQVTWEKYRQQRKADRNEIGEIFKTLSSARSLKNPLDFYIDDPNEEELMRAKKIHKSKIVNPKKWWLNLEWDEDIEAVGTGILDQIQEYKLSMYKERRLDFA
ncbi:hypothetical protein SteCoe_31812 [Stentor coeruleus]|uniref:Uncharacterized protein n=1 Tax=Stentor coeruleus TaxID=5963 RepID=A0A1R2B0F8_9CILI|nr:hypothetical protein SteCoe_31812 [Stentor coeruleus]